MGHLFLHRCPWLRPTTVLLCGRGASAGECAGVKRRRNEVLGRMHNPDDDDDDESSYEGDG